VKCIAEAAYDLSPVASCSPKPSKVSSSEPPSLSRNKFPSVVLVITLPEREFYPMIPNEMISSAPPGPERWIWVLCILITSSLHCSEKART
jgi:hypothetical protein